MIDYSLLGEAIEFYKLLGYEYIEVPWIATSSALGETLDDFTRAYRCEDKRLGQVGFLIGSAEQGVIQRLHDYDLKPGHYVSCTPCFRNEPMVDKLHHRTFMKVELSVVYDLGKRKDFLKEVQEILNHARSFMQSKTDVPIEMEVVQRDNYQYDLVANGIEVGSYGVRRLLGNPLILFYGTGLALPRFHQAISIDDGDSL